MIAPNKFHSKEKSMIRDVDSGNNREENNDGNTNLSHGTGILFHRVYRVSGLFGFVREGSTETSKLSHQEGYEKAYTNWLNAGSTSFFSSLALHIAVIVLLGFTPLFQASDEDNLVIVSSRQNEIEEEFRIIDELEASDVIHDEIGANSFYEERLADSSSPVFSDEPEIPNPVDVLPDPAGDMIVSSLFNQPKAPLDNVALQKGRVGEGVQGTDGAVDRLTFEILSAIEDRPTLVVWMFDQSGSLIRQRQQIRERFDRIYEELGIVISKRDREITDDERKERPLLTSVIGFGNEVKLFLEEPTDDLDEIKNAVDSLPIDTTGFEKPFTAVELAVERFKVLRRSNRDGGPQRNVILVLVTDERGDDIDKLDSAIKSCRRYGLPVYIIGTPAPLGREHILVKYVDPDPTYDQSPQWAEVDAGPESLMPEMVRFGFSGNFQEEPVIDSGFGPYGLTRLAFETGGIFFTVHPNRKVNREVGSGEIEPFASDIRRFFDPNVMSRYRPDYLSLQEYEKKLKSSPLRSSLVSAALLSAPTLDRPTTRFIKRSDAQLAGELTKAQQDAAKLEPALTRLADILESGLKVREGEITPRWRAGFDLAMGRVLAQKVRTETYNAMLAKAKRGMPFVDFKNNTWVLSPADEISVGSKWEREADLAKSLLQDVINQHPETPWSYLASQELKVPLGWAWKEEYTNLEPPGVPSPPGNNNNTPAPSVDEQKKMLAKPPSRPIPKL
jgi:hypothetical protein